MDNVAKFILTLSAYLAGNLAILVLANYVIS